ncbi:MAG: iron ABC transporter permease, partial [Oscillospiraceae bacterium]
IITLLCFAYFVFFFIYPISRVFISSVYNFDTNTFSFEQFTKFFTQKYYTNTILNSVKLTVSVTLITTVLGTALAYVTRTIKIKGKRLLDIVMLVSILSPPFIGAYSWIVLLGKVGILTQFINNTLGLNYQGLYGFGGILLVFVVKLTPLMYLYVSGALKNVDNSLMEASESLGCTGVRRTLKVLIPLILPTILASSLLVFMRALADFGTPQLIGQGYRTLPVLIYDAFIGEMGQDHAFAAAISVVIVIVTTVIFLLQKYFSGRKIIEMSSLNPIEPKKARGARNIFAHIFCYILITLATLPTLVVAYNSFQKTSGLLFIPGFSVESYQKAFGSMGIAIRNTFLYSFAALAIILVIGILTSYASIRKANALTGVLDTVTMFPYIIPGSVMGIALLTTFNTKPIILSGTAFIIITAFVIRRLPYTLRSSSAILRQINPNVEEASMSLGVNGAKTFLKVTLPMMIAGVLPGALMSWMSIISELSASVLLYTSKTTTMSISIYTEIIRNNYGTASALSTILTVTTIVTLLVFFKLSGRKEIEL